ncbi:MAG: hypothetical protein AB7T22_16385 [Calditrichaceae bacterium]
MIERKVTIAFIAVFFFFICFLQADLSDRKFNLSISHYLPAKYHQDVIYVPLQPSLIKLLSPSDPSFISDILWMRTAYYFGFHAMSDRQYPYLVHLLDVITDLSPKWEFPYFFGATLLPTEAESAEEGFYIINKGLRQFPDDWQLWFFKGYYQWHINHNLIEAAETFRHAAMLPGAPLYLSRLPATLATKAGQRELALRFIHESLNQVKDEKQKKILMEKLQEMLKHE